MSCFSRSAAQDGTKLTVGCQYFRLRSSSPNVRRPDLRRHSKCTSSITTRTLSTHGELQDVNYPEIPKADGRGVMDEEWTKMGEDGFRLAAINPQILYIFERCSPLP